MNSKKINQLATELAPSLSDLTIIGDPSTGISKKITLSQMASLFTGTVEEYANLASFPLVGTADTIYIALDTNIIYRWNTGTSAYVELSPNIVTSLVFNDANGFDGTISLVGSTATLTITTALTQGSVGFIGASGALTQDNSNFYWDNTNKRLGINTNVPTTAIDAFGSGIIGRLNGTSTNNAFLGFASAGTNKWSIGNVQSDHRFRIYSEANTVELVSVLQTGEFGIGIANPTTKLHIDGGASALIANLDANTSVAKSISFRSDNSARINLEVSGTESGSNAGANFFIRRYSDAGALIDTPFTITRSTGAITLTTALSGTSATFSGAVGIGTATSPAAELQVGKASDVTIALSNSSSVTSGNRGSIAWYNSSVSTVANIKATAVTDNVGTQLEFYTRPAAGSLTQVMTLASTGAATFSSSVTIPSGSTGGLYKMSYGASADSRSWQIASDAYNYGDFGIQVSNSQTGTSYTNALLINRSGNVGIGTSDPQSSLHIYSTNATAIIQNSSTSAVGNTSRLFYRALLGSGAIGYIGFIDGVLDSTSANTGYLKFHTYNNGNADERIRITSGGNLLIGTTTDGGQKLQVTGSAIVTSNFTTNANAYIGNSGNGVIISKEISIGAMSNGATYTYRIPQESFAFNTIWEVSVVGSFYTSGGSRAIVAAYGIVAWTDDGGSSEGFLTQLTGTRSSLGWSGSRYITFTNSSGYTTNSDVRMILRLINRN